MDALIEYFQRNYQIKPDGSVARKNGHRSSVFDVLMEYRKVCEMACLECTATEKDLQEYVDAHKPAQAGSTGPRPVDVIRGYLERHSGEWRINNSWTQFEFQRHGTPQNSDIDSLYEEIMTEVYHNNLKIKAEAIRVTLSSMAREASNSAVAALADSFAYSERYETAFDRWSEALYNYFAPAQSLEVFKTLWRHWMWQVKRKVMGLPVKNHIWLNFRGATGLGKTYSLEKIMKPLEEYMVSTTIGKLLDDTREMKKLTESYVIILDELAINSEGSLPGDETRLKSDQKATLKALLTQSKIQPRLMGGQRQTTRRITFCCISSANEHLYDIIYDSTTMRRFFEFDCKGQRPDSFEEINKYLDNSICAWRAINENLEDGYWLPNTDVWRTVEKEQQEYYPTGTTTGHWIDEEGITVGEEKAIDMYDEFKDYCKSHGHCVKNFQNWKTDVVHLIPGSVDEKGHLHIGRGTPCA